MDLTSYCNIHLEHHNPPIFVADMKTDKILYLNSAMRELLGEGQDVIGREFHKVISSRAEYQMGRQGEAWDMHNMTQMEIFNQELNMRFQVQHIPFEISGVMYNMCKYIPMNTTDSSRVSFNEAMSRCIWIIKSGNKNKVYDLLKLLGDYYDAEKTYYYTVNQGGMIFNCEVMWEKSGSDKNEIEQYNLVQQKSRESWLASCSEVGIVEIDKHWIQSTMNADELVLFDKLKLDNAVQSVIENKDKEIVALVGISNRKEMKLEYRFLRIITKLIEYADKEAELQEVFHKVSSVDILTGFCRSGSFTDKIREYQKNTPKSLGVILVNINGVKKINAEYGYAKGDAIIKRSAELLRGHFDIEFYRISGDEFIGFFENIEENVFEESVLAFRQKLIIDGENFLALGRVWRRGAYQIDKAIADVRTRMYINKQNYYGSLEQSTEEIEDQELRELMEHLESEEFMIYLQPQIAIQDQTLFGAEALIRRFDKTRGEMVYPNQFIPRYEKASIIRHIDIFVVHQVCKLLAEWIPNGKAIPISVNLSRVTLLEFGIVATLTQICDSYNVPHELVVIEVTEQMGLTANDVESSLITEFKERGFKISLDDFGCAYSNIITLAQVEVNEVKIDKSLVDDLAVNKKNAIIVKHILAMCNELNAVDTLAEGIEQQEQVDLLKEFHCHVGQGYLYSKPLPVNEFIRKYIEK